jgi:hypothetical protein
MKNYHISERPIYKEDIIDTENLENDSLFEEFEEKEDDILDEKDYEKDVPTEDDHEHYDEKGNFIPSDDPRFLL